MAWLTDSGSSPMTNIIARRFDQIKASPSMGAKAKVEALRTAGRRVVDFTIGEPDFPTPEHVVQAGIAALLQGETRYTAAAGTPALRTAIAGKLARENGLEFSASRIVVGCGAKHIIFNAFAASLEAGDEVIIPAPYWVSYPDMVAINGGTPVIVRCAESIGFKLTPELLEGAITPRTRWLVLNSPNNPTGAVYTRSELEALCAVLKSHPQVWLLTDEIYEHFVYGKTEHISALALAPYLADRTLVVNGVSKAYAMTGWRIGYGAGPLPLMQTLSLLMSQSTTCPSAISQSAAIAALEGPQEGVMDAAALYRIRRDLMLARLKDVPGIHCTVPDGAFYLFPSVAGLVGRNDHHGVAMKSDVDVVNFFLDAAGVASIDGSSYGMPGHVRFSFANSAEEIEEGCRRIRAAVASLVS
jgi:aspartate aminotransferase